MLNTKEKQITAKELHKNYEELDLKKEQILIDLQFSKEKLEDTFAVCKKHIAGPADVWKLRDYLEEKLTEQGKEVYPFSVLKPGRNHWFSYEKTW